MPGCYRRVSAFEVERMAVLRRMAASESLVPENVSCVGLHIVALATSACD